MGKLIRESLKVFLIFVTFLMFSCTWDQWDWGPPTQYAEKNAYPDFAYDGENLFIVWGGDDIYGRVLSPEGDFVTPIFEIANSENIEAEPEIVFLDPSFMVVWEEHLGEDEVRICCKRYNRKYAPTREHSLEILRGEGLSSPRIEKHSDGFVVLWYEWDMFDYDCCLSLFNLNGRELQREFLYDYTRPYASIQPLVRADNEDRYFLRGRSSARILGQDLGPIYELDFPRSGETYCCYGYDKWVSFEECREDSFPYIGHLNIRKTGFDGSVIPPDSIVIESEKDYFSNLTICPGDNTFLCVWQQYDNEGSTVNYIRLDSDGNLIDEESFVLFKNVHYEWARLKYAGSKFYWLWRSWRYDEDEHAKFDEKINLCMFSQEGGSLSARFVQVAK